MLKPLDEIRLTKISGKESASLPDGYTIKGFVQIAEEYRSLRISRYERNGETVEGLFVTSPVVRFEKIDDKTADIHTENSVWRAEIL